MRLARHSVASAPSAQSASCSLFVRRPEPEA
jgi:hypothetical protein